MIIKCRLCHKPAEWVAKLSSAEATGKDWGDRLRYEANCSGHIANAPVYYSEKRRIDSDRGRRLIAEMVADKLNGGK